MAAVDFPASPAVDQLFTVSTTGAIYKWTGTIWITVGNTSALYVGETPPANPWKSQLWFHSAQARLYIYFDDGNTTQWVPSAPIPATSAPPITPTPPGADPGCKTTYLGSQVALPGSYVPLVDTGLIGLAGQKWRISAFIGINNNPANWSYCEILVTAGSVLGGATQIGHGAIYNSVNGATANCTMESIETLTAPSTFTLRAFGSSAATAQAGRDTAITATRLT